ncbi:MAG: chorismate mutase [Chloroflexi bacterium]|nr:chorismate mutase [Chloroflexota bacterium]
MAVRGIRGAITADSNTVESIHEVTRELILEMIERNTLDTAEIASAMFTTTPDLNASFPAYAARMIGWIGVPLICTTEIPVPNALARVVRVLLHYNTDLPQAAMHHVYLRGAVALRQDLVERFGAAPSE